MPNRTCVANSGSTEHLHESRRGTCLKVERELSGLEVLPNSAVLGTRRPTKWLIQALEQASRLQHHHIKGLCNEFEEEATLESKTIC